MVAPRINALTRTMAGGATRRGVLGAIAGALGAGWSLADARKDKHRKRRKIRKKPLIFNQFACLNVGQACRGHDDYCCSGLCAGQKPRKGRRDKSRCVGHHEGGCSPERNVCSVGPASAACPPALSDGMCVLTTGNAGFCANLGAVSETNSCRLCTKDSDCTAAGFPPGSACVILSGVNCTECFATARRACLPPAI